MLFGIFYAYLVVFSLYITITKNKIKKKNRRRRINIINFDKSG